MKFVKSIKSGIGVSEIMTQQVVVAKEDMNIKEVASLMNRFRIGGLPVVRNGILVGLVTERDIMKNVIAKDILAHKVYVKDIMTKKLITAGPEEDMQKIAKKMSKYDITRIPIVSGNKLLGIVTNKDILKQSPELMEIIIEQAKIKNPSGFLDREPTSFGTCEACGTTAPLYFKKNKFLCEDCK